MLIMLPTKRNLNKLTVIYIFLAVALSVCWCLAACLETGFFMILSLPVIAAMVLTLITIVHILRIGLEDYLYADWKVPAEEQIALKKKNMDLYFPRNRVQIPAKILVVCLIPVIIFRVFAGTVFGEYLLETDASKAGLSAWILSALGFLLGSLELWKGEKSRNLTREKAEEFLRETKVGYGCVADPVTGHIFPTNGTLSRVMERICRRNFINGETGVDLQIAKWVSRHPECRIIEKDCRWKYSRNAIVLHGDRCEIPSAEIDHIIVTPLGVISIETKSYHHPIRVRGRNVWEYCGKEIESPLLQVDRHDRVLESFLSCPNNSFICLSDNSPVRYEGEGGNSHEIEKILFLGNFQKEMDRKYETLIHWSGRDFYDVDRLVEEINVHKLSFAE